MKIKTQSQKKVWSIASKLTPISQTVKTWAFQNCMKHLGYRTKKQTACLSCGHTWPAQTGETQSCPHCKRTLQIQTTRKKIFGQTNYFALLDVRQEYQIIRHFKIHAFHRAGTAPEICILEIIQQFLKPDGKNEVVARLRGAMGQYNSDLFHGELMIRDRNYLGTKYNVYPDLLYPKMKVLPIYTRNGFTGKMGLNSPYEIFTGIIADTKAETLLKAEQYSLLDARLSHRKSLVNLYWNSLKICIRNNYTVHNATDYLDYLDLLFYFRKDLNNPKYICPLNLKTAHDHLVKKKREVEKRLNVQRLIAKMKAAQEAYFQAKKAYIGLVFCKDNLIIKVLENVEEFKTEGEIHHHCIFTNSYFEKPDSLILSASVEGTPVETIEIDLVKLKVVQSRGKGNEPSKYSKDIRQLVRKNMHLIRQKQKTLKTA